jgi:hypothetical protein
LERGDEWGWPKPLHARRLPRSAARALVVTWGGFPDPVATTLDKDKLHDVLDQAVIVIDGRISSAHAAIYGCANCTNAAKAHDGT